MADAFLIPQVYNVVRFEMDINTWPTIAKVAENLKVIPEFDKAHADNQEDANK